MDDAALIRLEPRIRLQRASGEGRVAVRCEDGRTRLEHLFQEGCGKIRLPREPGDPGLTAVLINSSGATMLIIYLMVCAAQIRHRRLLEAVAPERLVLRMWWFPYASYLTAGAMLAVLIAMAFKHDLAVQLVTSLAVAALVWLAYWVFRRRQLA